MAGQGNKELRTLRLKAEATNGTPVAPRFIWRGLVEGIADLREINTVEENIGHFGGSDRTYTGKIMAELPIPQAPATFEQLPDLFLMAGFGTAGGGNRAGSAQGASGSAVVFTLPVPDTSIPVAYSCTAEVGGNAWVEVMEYALCKKLDLKFAGGDAMQVTATLFGRQGTATNAVGSFSVAVGTAPTVETIVASRGSFWLAPVGSGFGTGQVTAGNILAGKLNITPKWTPKFPVDSGMLTFATAVYTGCDIEGELTLEAQVSGTYGVWGSAGQKEKWRSELPQVLQMTWRGGTILAGTTYGNKELTIQLPIKWTKFDPLGDMDGNEIVVGKFVSKFDELNPAATGRGTVTIVRLGTSEISGA